MVVVWLMDILNEDLLTVGFFGSWSVMWFVSFHLEATSTTFCDEVKGTLVERLIGITLKGNLHICRIAWLLSNFVLLPLRFQAVSATFCDKVQGIMVVEQLIGITLKKNSPSVGLVGHWSMSCSHRFLYWESLTNFVIESKGWWQLRDWWVSYWRRIR